MPGAHDVDLSDEDQRRVAAQIARGWRELRRGASTAVLRERWFALGETTLEPSQVDAVELLAQRGEWRMSDLADELQVDPSTATRAVQRLVAVGLAERRPCDRDGRVVQVSLTTAGRQFHANLVDERRRTMAALLAAFDPQERAEFGEYLERFVTALRDFVAGLPETP